MLRPCVASRAPKFRPLSRTIGRAVRGPSSTWFAWATAGSTRDADALPGIIAELKRRGYGFVTISDSI